MTIDCRLVMPRDLFRRFDEHTAFEAAARGVFNLVKRHLVRRNASRPKRGDFPHSNYWARRKVDIKFAGHGTAVIQVGSAGDGGAAISLVDGEPVFIIDGKGVANADFHKRWIAEHPVPLVLRRGGATRLIMEPTVGNRVKVRRARFGGLTLPPAFW